MMKTPKEETIIHCNKCGEDKQSGEFYRKEGKIMTPCKECRKSHVRKRYLAENTDGLDSKISHLKSARKRSRASTLYGWIEQKKINHVELLEILKRVEF